MSTTVYKLYGATGTLLYVGMTKTRLSRIMEHTDKPWWSDVSSIELEHFATRAEATHREASLIAERNPVYNDSLLLYVRKPNEYQSLGDRIRASRRLLAITRRALLSGTDIVDGTMLNWEKGRVRPNRRKLAELQSAFVRWAEKLGVDVELVRLSISQNDE